MNREITLVSMESRTKNPSIYMEDASVIASVASRCNKKVSNSVIAAEILQMYLLRTESETYTLTGDMVSERNGQLEQTHGGDIWSLASEYRSVQTDSTYYTNTDEKKRMEIRCPPDLYHYMNREYGERGWCDVISRAVGMYKSQPFFSLSHVLSVQRDIIQENFDTDIGQWISESAGNWWENLDTEFPEHWGDAYQEHVDSNTPYNQKIQWIEQAFVNIFGDNKIEKSTIESYLEDHFGESARESAKKCRDVDMDTINAVWYDNVSHLLDSDVDVSTPSELVDMMDTSDNDNYDDMIDTASLLSSLDSRPEVLVDQSTKTRACRQATRNTKADIDWHDLTFNSRVTIASDVVDSVCEHKDPEDIGQGSDTVDDVETRMDAINSATGDNQ